MLCVFGFGLVACKPDGGHPPKGAVGENNGGFSVKVGNFLYFVNGYNDTDDLTSKNQTFTVGALMVAELDENGNLQRNENGEVENARVLSNALCGFEATNLFANKGYLYFTTPCLEDVSGKVGDAEWAKQRVVFNRMNLETEKVEKVYQSTVNNDKLSFKYFFNGSNAYLLVFESGTSLDNADENVLYRVDLNNKKNVEKVATKLSTVVWDTTSNVEVGEADQCANVFFALNRKKNGTDETENVLFRYNVASNSKTEYEINANEIKVKFVSNKYVYATIKNGENEDLYRANFKNDEALEMLFASNNFTQMFLTEDGEDVVVCKENKILMIPYGSQNPISNVLEDDDATTVQIIGIKNGYIIYCNDKNAVKMASCNDLKNGEDVESVTLTTVEKLFKPEASQDAAAIPAFDLDENYLYFYKTVGDNDYLHRIKIANNVSETEELVGKYLSADIPEAEEA